MIYRIKKYQRWLREFGVDGLYKLLKCGDSVVPVRMHSRRLGPLVCRNCREDFEAINTVLCFDAYHVDAPHRPYRSVVDLGGNIGIASRYFHFMLPHVRILAIEPYAPNCELFKMNMSLIGKAPVDLLECAVGMRDGVGWLTDGCGFDRVAVKPVDCHQSASDRQAVVIRSLTGLLQGLPGPILLKMDIEGAETDVLKSREQWAGDVGRMMIEFHNDDDETSWRSMLEDEGWQTEKHFDTWHFYK